MTSIQYQPIGLIHSPHTQPEGTPIQPTAAQGIRGSVEVYPEFIEGLRDLGGFSHIILLYHCHRAKESKLRVKPFLDDVEHGVFATRAPASPPPPPFGPLKIAIPWTPVSIYLDLHY